ncbi:MAG TPA: MFS transporter [Peptococcaceae bacterium]|nr:MFS transporter [Peptococcaceae bacterium]
MKKNPWLVLIAVYLVSIGIVMAQFKVPPIMPVIIGEFQLDMVSAGWLMSIFSVTAVILAFPAALVLKKLGPKVSGLVSIGCAILGSFLGYLAPNFQVLMLSRIIEGVGLGLIAVIAPSVIAMWFPPEKRGLPMGIWASWVPCGISIIFALAPNLAEAYGRQSLWLFTAVFAIIAFILYALFVSNPEGREEINEQSSVFEPRLADGLKYSGVWILAFTFFLFNIGVQSFNNWAPTYMIEVLHVEPPMAGYYMSYQTIISIIGAVIAGWCIDRVQNKKMFLTIVFVVIGAIWLFAFNLSTNIILPYMTVFGICTIFAPSLIFTMAPRTVPSLAYAGIAMACANFGQNLGNLVAPPAIGGIIQNAGWLTASWVIGGAGFLAAIAVLFYKSADSLR